MRQKKWLCFGLALALSCANLQQVSAYAQEGVLAEEAAENLESLTWRELEDGTLEIVAYSGNDTMLTVPEAVEGKRVTRIGGYAFSGNGSLEGIVLPGSITEIGDCAFWGCGSLKEIAIPESVSKIPRGMLKGCQNLSAAVIPEGVTEIGYDAFEGCSSLSQVVIPDSVKQIGHEAFTNTAWLESQPEGVVYAGKIAYAYKGVRDSLTAVDIPEGICGIADQAFKGCKSLAEVEISSTVQYIGKEAFGNCHSLEDICIPASVTEIGERAFGYEGVPDDDFAQESSESAWVWEWERKPEFQVLCSPGSAAQDYAEKNGMQYIQPGEGQHVEIDAQAETEQQEEAGQQA